MSTQIPEPIVNGVSQRELELIAKVKALEDDRVKFLEIVRGKIQKLEKELEVTIMGYGGNGHLVPVSDFFNFIQICDRLIQLKTAENEKIQARNTDLESSLKDIGSLTSKGKKATKSEDDDLLTRARELLFEKTKICKKQELQLEALNNQLDATKEVLEITKDMLNLRNIESDHQQARLDSFALKVKAERERYNLTEKKLASAKQMETELRKEYSLQNGIFKVMTTK